MLFEIYKDDLCAPHGDLGLLEDRPIVPAPGTGCRYPSRTNFQDTFKWLCALASFEEEVLADIAGANGKRASKTLSLFDGQYITTHLMRGLRRSVEVVYKNVITAGDAQELEQHIARMETRAASAAGN